MKNLFTVFALLAISVPAMAAVPAVGRGRASMSNQMDARAATKKQLNNATGQSEDKGVTGNDGSADTTVEEEVKKDMREREKAACIQNNIGVGATFVWASRFSNTANYNSMIEDTEFPENNVCFVKVAMKSNDSRIDVSDIPTKYFVMGETITCGDWTNEEKLKERISDAKKKGRTWATVGGAIGGAGIGVGAMELFGNKLIGGAVEGQADMSGTDLLCSQMKVLHQEKSSRYDDIRDSLKDLQQYCEDDKLWTDTAKPETCKEFDYKELLKC